MTEGGLNGSATLITLPLNGVIVTAPNIRHSQGLYITLIILMKSPYRPYPHGIDLNGPGINFGKGLNLNIIAPDPVPGLPFNILLDVLNQKILKKLFFLQYIPHAQLSNLVVVGFLAIKLVRDRSEETVAITTDLLHGEVVVLKLFEKFGQFLT